MIMNVNDKVFRNIRVYTLFICFLLPLTTFAENSENASITLNQRQLCDLELLINGGFAPLEGFMDKDAYESVVNEMRLPDGEIWPIPIVLDVSEKTFTSLKGSKNIALRDQEGVVLAYLEVSDTWRPDKMIEAEKVYGTSSKEHPGVDYLFSQAGTYYIGGKITAVSMPRHYDFVNLRHTPKELKRFSKIKGIRK